MSADGFATPPASLGTHTMKLKADRATLLKALAHVQSVVEKRNTIPILANVLLAVDDGRLTLTATDMEIAIVETVAASGAHNGRCTAPAATLYEIVRKLPEGAEVELELAGGDAQ
jgi:DNA polymerase III subunit beta